MHKLFNIPENYDIVKSANVLNRFVKEELISIDLCYECYINLEHDWFELPCKVPHLLIWAKQRTFPYWPAKLMRFNQRDNTIDVRYFGDDHLRAVLPAKNCLLFSRQNPSFSIGSLKKALELAQKVYYFVCILSLFTVVSQPIAILS